MQEIKDEAAAATASTTPQKHSHSSDNLSRRGTHNATFVRDNLKGVLDLLRNQYDPVTNPNGIVILGVADNALMRDELVQWFNADRLKLQPRELNYGDRLFSSVRLVDALCTLFNDVPVGLSTAKPKLIQQVKPEHIVVGSGATGILDALFTILCNPDDGVLLSVPYYNGFDHDLTSRSEVKIVEVVTPLPDTLNPANPQKPAQPSPAFTPDTVKAYEKALARARSQGRHVSTILVCNPHNPTGLIYPRETLIAIASLAAKENLHLVVDEIYARSVFESRDIDASNATPFETILSIDVEKEASLPRSKVHVVTSASKDFGINGFRHGVYVNQGNTEAIDAMTALGMLSQGSSPAGALWYTWLEDREFLDWYFRENHRRLAGAYEWVTDWARHHKIPYVASNSGHYIMLDFQRFLKVKGDGSDHRAAEAQLNADLFQAGVFIAPGAQYHHPVPGWFRLTIAQSPTAVKEGIARAEGVLGLESYAHTVPVFDVRQDMLPLPPSLLRITREQVNKEIPGAPKPTLTGLPDDNKLLSAISKHNVADLTAQIREAPARNAHKLISAIAHNSLLLCLSQPHRVDDVISFVLDLSAHAQTANPDLRGIQRDAGYLQSELQTATGAGETLLEHFVAEVHTAILEISTNTSTPNVAQKSQSDAPPASFWFRGLVYGTVLGRLFSSPRARGRSWRAVEDLLIKGLLSPGHSCGTPALGTVVLIPALLLTSAAAIKAYLGQGDHKGRGTHHLWYDNVRTKPDAQWEWTDIVKALTDGGMDRGLVAGVGRVIPNAATSTWQLASEQVTRQQTSENDAKQVMKLFQWVFDLQTS